jgi:PAS domain S-box-containing protein
MSSARDPDVTKALHALTFVEARWQAVLDAIQDAVISIDTEGLIVLFNRSAERIFGYRTDEVLGKNIALLMPAPYRDEHDRHLHSYQRTGIAKAIGRVREVQAIRKTGEVFPIELSVSEEAKLENRIIYTAIIRDVSTRKRTEEALRRERDFAERLIETAPVIALVLDAEGRVVRFNPYMETLTGHRLEEVQGRDWFTTFLPERDRSRIRRVFEKALQNEQIVGNINPIVTRAGVEREIEWHAKTLNDADGVVVGVLSVGQDITERVLAERRFSAQYSVTRVLAESGSLVEATPRLLRAICQGVGWHLGEIWHVDGNGQALRLDGVWHVPGMDVREFLEATRQVTFSRGVGLLGRVWAKGEPEWVADIIDESGLLRTDAARLIGLRAALAFPIASERGVVGIMSFFHTKPQPPDREWLATFDALGRQIGDFVERKRAETDLRQLQEQAQQHARLADIGAIAAKVAHDLGNPLAAVSMQAQLILRRARRDLQQPVGGMLEPVNQIITEVKRLETLIREFMEFAREQRLELTTIDTRRFLQEIVQLWRPFAEGRSITIGLDLSAAAPTFRVDAAKLHRVIDNLIKNAVEAIDRGPGHVRVRVTLPSDGKIRISVEDDGCGIPEDLEVFRLFETTKAGGTGLGLAVAREIVRAHGGEVHFERLQPHGTVFHVDLPQAPL